MGRKIVLKMIELRNFDKICFVTFGMLLNFGFSAFADSLTDEYYSQAKEKCNQMVQEAKKTSRSYVEGAYVDYEEKCDYDVFAVLLVDNDYQSLKTDGLKALDYCTNHIKQLPSSSDDDLSGCMAQQLSATLVNISDPCGFNCKNELLNGIVGRLSEIRIKNSGAINWFSDMLNIGISILPNIIYCIIGLLLVAAYFKWFVKI